METDYLNFLKTFYQEELYLIEELDYSPENSDTLEKEEIPAATERRVEESTYEATHEWNYTGNYDAPIAFILDEESAEALPETIKVRFETMISRLNLDTNNIIIANRSGKAGSEMESKICDLKASKIVVLGAENIFSSASKQEYQPQPLQNKQFLLAPPFSEILEDKQKVKMLWEGLVKLI